MVAEKKMVPQCRLQLESEMRPYTPSTEEGTDDFFGVCDEEGDFGGQVGIEKECWKEKKCVEKMAINMCLKRQMKWTLNNMVGVRKRAAQERLLQMLGYELIGGPPKPEKRTELGEMLKK